MDNSNHIDVNKLTKEAEAGHGHNVRAELDQIPFEEKIRLAHEMVNISKTHNKETGSPIIEFVMQDCMDNADAGSENGYTKLQLYRRSCRSNLWPLFTKTELLYEDALNLTTGEQTAKDSDL